MLALVLTLVDDTVLYDAIYIYLGGSGQELMLHQFHLMLF